MSPVSRKLRVFLCHASQDKPVVRELYQRLLAEGWVDPWLDEAKILPGQNWEPKISRALKNSDIIVLCLSKAAVLKKGYIQKEIRAALELSEYTPIGSIFIIPLRLEDCFVPPILAKLHYIDFFPNESKERAYPRLLQALEIRLQEVVEQDKISPPPANDYTPLKPNRQPSTSSRTRKTNTSLVVMIFLSAVSAFILLAVSIYWISRYVPSLIGSTATAYVIDLPTSTLSLEVPAITSFPTDPTETLVPIILPSAPPPTQPPVEIQPTTPATPAEKIISPENVNALQVLYESDLEDNWDIKFSPDGNSVAIGNTESPSYKAKIWTFKENVMRDLPMGFDPVAFSPGGNYVAVSRGNGSGDELSMIAKVFSLPDFSEVSQLNGYQAAITQVKFFPDEQRLATGSLDRKIVIWDLHSGSELKNMVFEGQVHDFDIDSTGQYIVTTGFLKEEKVYLVDTASGSFVNKFSGNNGTITAVRFSPNGELIAAGDGMNTDSESYAIYLWRTTDGTLLRALEGQNVGIDDLEFSPDGKILVSSTVNGLVFWNVATGEKITSMNMPSIFAIDFDPKGRYVAVARGFPDNGVFILGVR